MKAITFLPFLAFGLALFLGAEKHA